MKGDQGCFSIASVLSSPLAQHLEVRGGMERARAKT
jgi:hypothetical protein